MKTLKQVEVSVILILICFKIKYKLVTSRPGSFLTSRSPDFKHLCNGPLKCFE